MFRNKIDRNIDSDTTKAILKYLNYPFGKYLNAEGKNIYPRSIIEGYFDTPFDRRRIETIMDTIRYNNRTSDEIKARYEKLAKLCTMPDEEREQLRQDIEDEHTQRYAQYIEDNPPETSMKYVSDRQLLDDDVMYESLQNNTNNIQEAIDAVVGAGLMKEDDIDPKWTHIYDNGGFTVAAVTSKEKENSRSSHKNCCYVYCFDNKKIITPKPIDDIFYLNKKSKCYDKFFEVCAYVRPNHFEDYNLLTKDGFVFDEFALRIEDLYNGDFIINPYDINDGRPFLWNFDGTIKLNDLDDIQELENSDKFLRVKTSTCYQIIDKSGNVIIDNITKIINDGICVVYNTTHEYMSGRSVEEPIYIISFADNNPEYNAVNIYNGDMELMFEDVFYEIEEIDKADTQMIYIENGAGGTGYNNMVGRNGMPLFEQPVDYIDREFVEDCKLINHVTYKGKDNLILCDTLELYDDEWFDDIVCIDYELSGFEDETLIALKRNKDVYLISVKDSSDVYLEEINDTPFQDICVFGKNKKSLIVKKDQKYYLLLKTRRMLQVDPRNVREHPDDNCNIVYIKGDDGKIDIVDTYRGEIWSDKHDTFDSISDISSKYPIVGCDGKYTYFDIEWFDLALSIFSIPLYYDKAEPAEYDEENDEYFFNVELNGEKRRISATSGENVYEE